MLQMPVELEKSRNAVLRLRQFRFSEGKVDMCPRGLLLT